MHNNPFNVKWHLAINALDYIHSSATFYLTGEQGFYPVTNFMEMEDADFNKTNTNSRRRNVLGPAPGLSRDVAENKVS